MNVGMKYFEYYILYVSVWLFVIFLVLFCFVFFAMDITWILMPERLSLMLLCCWIPFHFYTVHAGNFSSSTLQFFEIVDFVIIVVVVFNNGFFGIRSTAVNSNLQGKSGVRVIGSSKKIAESKVKNSFYCTVNILITFNFRNVQWKLKHTSRL